MNRLEALHDAGVSIWLDTLSRQLLDSGDFTRLIADCAVTGATSNPTIFAKAITGSDRYDAQPRAAVAAGVRDPPGALLRARARGRPPGGGPAGAGLRGDRRA
jgi:transaldolase